MYAPDPTTEHTDNFVAGINLSKNYRIKCVRFSLFQFSNFKFVKLREGEEDLLKDSTFMLQKWGGGAPSPLR